MNIIISDGHSVYCPQCFSNNLIHDFSHAEYYCGDCGLVVMDHSHSLTSQIDNYNYVETREKELQEHLNLTNSNPMTSNLTYGDLFDKINEEIEIEKAKKKKAKKKKK